MNIHRSKHFFYVLCIAKGREKKKKEMKLDFRLQSVVNLVTSLRQKSITKRTYTIRNTS